MLKTRYEHSTKEATITSPLKGAQQLMQKFVQACMLLMGKPGTNVEFMKEHEMREAPECEFSMTTPS